MISVLIVDDSSEKVESVKAVIEDVLLTEQVRITVARTVYAALQELAVDTFALMILDINIPLRENQAAAHNGGMKLLAALGGRRKYNRPQHIVGLTAYEELEAKYAGDFAGEMWYLIRYSESSDEWMAKLGSRLLHIVESGAGAEQASYDVDLAIVTALEEVELESVLDLPANWISNQIEGDDTIYRMGKFNRGGEQLRVVASAAVEMGMPASAALAMKMICNFRPRYLAMTGICAGVKGNFGDIVVADQAWDYGSGKSSCKSFGRSKFLPAPVPILLDASMSAKFACFALRKEVPRKIQADWMGDAPTTTLISRRGPMASGAAVLENKPMIEEIAQRNRKVLGVDMETYGVFMAARIAKQPRPMVMAIKSVCDFGDSRKDDKYQEYAAFTSAQYLYHFALDHLFQTAPLALDQRNVPTGT